MSILAESVIAAFDSNTEIIWSLETASKAVARFSITGAKVKVTFWRWMMSRGGWHLTWTPNCNWGDGLSTPIRVFGGVFQAVAEFLEVRQPYRLIFAFKDAGVRYIHETYLKRQDTELNKLGYWTETAKKSPTDEFTIVKITPSDWKS